MRTNRFDNKIFVERCESLRENLINEKAGVLLFSGTEKARNHDVLHPFRVNSNFFYLTGFEEPESAFLYRPGAKFERVLFVRKKDPKMETWTGFRFGVDQAKKDFEMDAVYEIDDFSTKTPSLFAELSCIYYGLYQEKEFDATVEEALNKAKIILGRSGRGIIDIKDPYPLIGEKRIIKSDFEIEMTRKACELSIEAHIELMKTTKSGVNERELHGLFYHQILKRGAAREAYPSIIASGHNATTLHYEFNDRDCLDGDMILVDAGGEYNYYAADITRTYPVNGLFNKDQARVYRKVLKIQKAAIEKIKPGATLKKIGEEASLELAELMIEEDLLTGNPEALVASGEHKKYYPHGLGHWLGIDVHDAGQYEINKEPRMLEPGMMFTIEPGLYIPLEDTSAPRELRGLGIRIEDNLLVTKDGYENMTAAMPKEIEDIEETMKG